MVGRALWGEAVTAPTEERPRLVENILRPRFAELASIARNHGRDWASKHDIPAIDDTWYPQY
jgi:hypothetical protein